MHILAVWGIFNVISITVFPYQPQYFRFFMTKWPGSIPVLPEAGKLKHATLLYHFIYRTFLLPLCHFKKCKINKVQLTHTG